METMLKSLGERLSLSEKIIKEAAALHRRLEGKQASLGLSVSVESGVCLQLAAENQGKTVDLKTISKCAGSKSKAQYLDSLQNIRTILGLGNSLTLQELVIQINAMSLINPAKELLNLYEKHIRETYGEDRAKSVDTSKELYLCAAVYAAGKQVNIKLDTNKLVILGKTKKKEMTDLGSEMIKLVPVKSVRKSSSTSSGPILTPLKESNRNESGVKRKVGEMVEMDDEGFQEWKKDVLRKAVAAGFNKYRKYL
ncbi:uncharacterized protein LOC111704053 [Eurytemora carolleeae]|uniref:uncharacterized protein LOC111704053 n=1 Tax=Eurytemora carolleeae TaxID=1294199 RepID=UPI000C757E96|nr:uncharacterized protein LOC111704053 [Eurytemora carolleeae]|eukprot:XP_023331943.1 uncharacterized protein LOC111704053 [Eurytemora affinis]